MAIYTKSIQIMIKAVQVNAPMIVIISLQINETIKNLKKCWTINMIYRTGSLKEIINIEYNGPIIFLKGSGAINLNGAIRSLEKVGQ